MAEVGQHASQPSQIMLVSRVKRAMKTPLFCWQYSQGTFLTSPTLISRRKRRCRTLYPSASITQPVLERSAAARDGRGPPKKDAAAKFVAGIDQLGRVPFTVYNPQVNAGENSLLQGNMGQSIRNLSFDTKENKLTTSKHLWHRRLLGNTPCHGGEACYPNRLSSCWVVLGRAHASRLCWGARFA